MSEMLKGILVGHLTCLHVGEGMTLWTWLHFMLFLPASTQ